MNNSQLLRIKLIGLGLLALIILILISLIIFSAVSPSQTTENNTTPTPVPTTPVTFDSEHLTPLQKTTIGQTTDAEVVKNQEVISKTLVGTITIYKIKSAINGETDEIRTKDGKVILERTSTQIASPVPPKVTQVESTFGNPEEQLKSVGPVGWYTNAYLYPSRGIAFYLNRYTGTVYEVQRFTPMTLTEYKKTFPEFVQPAKSEPEYFDKR